VLRSVGADTVRVRPQPRVGVLSTGDELVTGSEPLRPGQIRDSNRPTLLAMVAGAGAVPVDLGHVRDDEDALTAAFTGAAERCDAVLSTGGVSMGDIDLVKVVLDKLGNAAGGGGMRWMQVAVKPAKPLAFGVIGARRVPVFGLPGNPVSSMVAFELFVRPVLLAMQGAASIYRPRAPVILRDGYRKPAGRAHYLRARLHRNGAGVIAEPHAHQGSHAMTSMIGVDALIEIGASVTEIAPGGAAPALLLRVV
jgi:molybdopterin molybdotransferase